MITILISSLKTRSGLLLAFALLGLTIVACGTSEEAADDSELQIVATTSIWGDVVTQIVGEDASVEVVMPRGVDAHAYQATSRQVAVIGEADLVVANGLGLEEGLADVLEAAVEDGVNILEVGPGVDPLPFENDAEHEEDHEEEAAEHEEEGDEEHEHEHGEFDPHVWFDPARVVTAATLIAERLSEIDPSVDWAERAQEYSAELLQVDEELVAQFDRIQTENRKLVTNHEALGYLAERYDFELIGVVIPGGSTLAEPSSAELATLVEEIEHEGVTAIFAETTESTELADAVAAEVGYEVDVIELYTGSLGEPGSDAGTLTGMLLTDAMLIVDGLS